MLCRSDRKLLLTVVVAGMLTYCILTLPVHTYWRTTNSQQRDFSKTRVASENKSPVATKNDDSYPAESHTSDSDLLIDLPVWEEDDTSGGIEERHTFLHNFILAAPNTASPPPAEWKTRVSLHDFPQASSCSQDSSVRDSDSHGSDDTLYVYPCKRIRHLPANNKAWPVLLQPSKGELLTRIAQRRYTDPKVEALVAEQLQVQRRRLARIAETCEAYAAVVQLPHLSLVWAGERSPPLVYCPIYKSASTTWMGNFLRLKHLYDDKPAPRGRKQAKHKSFHGDHNKVFKLYPNPKSGKDKRRIFENAIKFLVVRHPFDRLLSAYRDKIERPNPLPYRPYFQHLQRAIVARYRAPAGNASLPPQPTFSEFVDYLIESTENLKTERDWKENVICWIPYWAQCGVCISDYQVVIKVETMKSDEQFLAHVANLTELQDGSAWRNRRQGQRPDYFRTLTRQQVQDLYLRYKEDFELFGYTIEEYLDSARKV